MGPEGEPAGTNGTRQSQLFITAEFDLFKKRRLHQQRTVTYTMGFRWSRCVNVGSLTEANAPPGRGMLTGGGEAVHVWRRRYVGNFCTFLAILLLLENRLHFKKKDAFLNFAFLLYMMPCESFSRNSLCPEAPSYPPRLCQQW